MARDRKRFGLGLAIVLSATSSARAYDEQWSLDAAAGYALITSDDSPTRQGAAVDVGATLGVSDSVMLRGTLGYAYLTHEVRDERRHEHLGRLRAEGLYLLDVLKLVPFFGVGVALTNAPLPEDDWPVRPGVHLVLGLDYLASRSWTAGLDVRSGVMFVSDGLLSVTDVSLRISRPFEWF